MRKTKQKWLKSIFGSDKLLELIKKVKTTFANKFHIARAMSIFIILLLFMTFVSAGNVTVQAGDFDIDGNMTSAKDIDISGYYYGDASRLSNLPTGMDYTNLALTNQSNTFGAFNQIFDTNTVFIDAVNNRLGVGTITPSDALEVNGNVSVASGYGYKFLGGANGDPYLVMYTDGRETSMYSGRSNQGGMRLYESDGDYIGSFYGSAAGGMGLKDSGDQYLINSNLASTLFFVNGTEMIRIRGQGIDGVAIDSNYIVSGTKFDVNLDGQFGASGSFMISSARAQQGDFLIVKNGTGDVGIGDNTPSHKLDVNGNVSADYYFGDGSQLSNLPAGMDYTNLALTNQSNTFGAFNQIFDTDTVFIDAVNNRVGIGTTAPTHKLNVVGDLNVTGDIIRSSGAVHSYVVRDASTPDFDKNDFTTDGAWKINTLNLSSIVPAGATAVHLEIVIQDDSPQSLFRIRRSSGYSRNRLIASSLSGNLSITQDGIVAIDSDRLLDYMGDSVTLDSLFITVLGWYI